MQKVMISAALGIVSSALAALPLITFSGTADAEIARIEHPVVANPVSRNIDGNVQDSVVEQPAADAEAIRIHRENIDYDDDGIVNTDDPDDDNDGIMDADDPDDDDDGIPDDQE